MFDEDEIATGEFTAVQLDDDGNPVIPRVEIEWLWRMMDVVREMEEDPSFEVHHSEVFRGVPDVVKEMVESAGGLDVAPTIASLYTVSDGFEFEWSYEEDGEMVPGGQIHLYGFAEVFGTWLDSLWGALADDAEPSEEDFTWELRGFDAAREDDVFMTVLHVPEVLPAYNLYWHAPGHKTYRLRVDFLEYLERLVETRGLHGWQYMVCDVDLESDDEALERVRQCTSLMRRLFPDVDLSAYTTAEPEGAPTVASDDEDETENASEAESENTSEESEAENESESRAESENESEDEGDDDE